MSITQLTPPNARVDKTVRIHITSDTVIASSTGGKTIGVPVYTGSVIDVSEYDANTLFSSLKAERAEPGAQINIVKPSEPERKK